MSMREPRTTLASDAAPRCEVCGYEIRSVLEAAGPDASCPECGTPCRQSAPSLRPGSPWQRHPTGASLALTCWLTIARPATLFRSLAPISKGAGVLLALQTSIAAVAFLSPWSGVFIADPVRQLRFARTLGRLLQIVGAVVIEVALLAAFLCLATLVIAWTIRAYGRVRGWSVSRGCMLAVASHASVGWTVAAGVVWSLLTAWFVATVVISAVANPAAGRLLGDASGWLATVGGRYGLLPLPALILGFGGVLTARITWVGLLACRFANDPAAAAEFQARPATEAQ